MSADIGKGDWVECVSLSSDPVRGSVRHLTVGAIYKVREVGVILTTGSGGEIDGLRLEGYRIFVAGWGKEAGFPTCCFRPIYRPRKGAFDHLKAPVTRTPKVVRDRSREAV